MSAPAQVTEAHRKLATELCRNATGSNRALHHVPKFAQLIADSEARAVEQARENESWKLYAQNIETERNQLRTELATCKDASEALIESLRAEIVLLSGPTNTDKTVSDCHAMIYEMQEAQEKLRAELAMAEDAAQKGESGRKLGTALEEATKEIDQLRAEMERLRNPSTIVPPGSQFCEQDYHTLKARAEKAEKIANAFGNGIILAVNQRDSAEAELDSIKRGHGELGRYEKLRLKNAALTTELTLKQQTINTLLDQGSDVVVRMELVQEKAAHAGTRMLLDAREDELSKERARLDWVLQGNSVFVPVGEGFNASRLHYKYDRSRLDSAMQEDTK